MTVVLAADLPGQAAVQFLLDGQPLGEAVMLNANDPSVGTDLEAVFTRTLPPGIQHGLHSIGLATTEQPPRVLASRTVRVVGSAPSLQETPSPAAPASSTQTGLIVAVVVGGVAAMAATGFGVAAWYRRKMPVRRLKSR
ncbi:MAG: hypothetical protein OEM84_11570 [Acidimicrobiia bacterium]|nr:hypothetical protein [Acidimicrobiia bacterium]